MIDYLNTFPHTYLTPDIPTLPSNYLLPSFLSANLLASLLTCCPSCLSEFQQACLLTAPRPNCPSPSLSSCLLSTFFLCLHIFLPTHLYNSFSTSYQGHYLLASFLPTCSPYYLSTPPSHLSAYPSSTAHLPAYLPA